MLFELFNSRSRWLRKRHQLFGAEGETRLSSVGGEGFHGMLLGGIFQSHGRHGLIVTLIGSSSLLKSNGWGANGNTLSE